MTTHIRAFVLRLILILAGLAAMPLAAHADALQSIADAAAQYTGAIEDQYGSTQNATDAAKHVKEGNAAASQNDTEAAVVAFQKAIAAGDRSAATWNLLANAGDAPRTLCRRGIGNLQSYQASKTPGGLAPMRHCCSHSGKRRRTGQGAGGLSAEPEAGPQPVDHDHADTLEELRVSGHAKSTSTAGDYPKSA